MNNTSIITSTGIINPKGKEELNSTQKILVPPAPTIIILDQIDLINKAKEFAKRAHDGQARLDGTEFVTHPMRVAENVEKYVKLNQLHFLIAAGDLHDTLEDTDTTYRDLYIKFGATVANLVMELTSDDDMKHKLGKAKYLSKKMEHMSNLALAIKLCDRLDNISDLEKTSPKFREKYTKETLEIIDYILKVRTLTKTHLTIIKLIVETLASIISLEDEKSASIKRLSFTLANLESQSITS